MRALEARRTRARAGRDQQLIIDRGLRARAAPHATRATSSADDARENTMDAVSLVKIRSDGEQLIFAQLAEQVGWSMRRGNSQAPARH